MKKLNILLIGGTKDASNITQHIKKNYDSHILTTTTTEYGSKLAIESGSDDTIAKPLLKEEFIELIENNNFNLLIDATHPYAAHITQTSVDLSDLFNIAYIRFERPPSNLEKIDTSRVHEVNSLDEAGKLIAKDFTKGNILHLAGANTSLEENIKIIDKTDASVIITKESGDIGGVINKINAANMRYVDVIMLKRPKIKDLNKKDIISNLEQLDEKINSYF